MWTTFMVAFLSGFSTRLFDELLQAPDQRWNMLGANENADVIAFLGAEILLPNADVTAVRDVTRQCKLLLADDGLRVFVTSPVHLIVGRFERGMVRPPAWA
jgi:hypothetical protein